ncbi:AraC family transcriptional regulator [Pseudomonas asiatica]|uniref:helix-turn-helix domain-containing protein n=1 Tax=Pseudomonas asiatica TaxID=2219225 RepID=UPI00209B3343|nr:AraC family transcriptional regulator [Pseudomonas asiatica]MCO7524865.1 AraC family transcriptional regulator [Pseudomonas asiatica]
MKYQIVDQLQKHNATLREHIALDDGAEFAAWSNHQQLVNVESDHHTLSMYVHGGEDCYFRSSSGWRNGGGPGRICLMPRGEASMWDIRGKLDFVHLYYTDKHLHDIAVKVWDKEPSSIELPPLTFSDDEIIRTLYQSFILNCDWSDRTNHLQMSSCTLLLFSHLVKNYGSTKWAEPSTRGGLSPSTLKQVIEWIEANLDKPQSISDLAEQANMSFYHFAHMFKTSTNVAPHQYVMDRRLARAMEMVKGTDLALTEISELLGFSSAAHFSSRFKSKFGVSPSLLRRQAN